MRRVRNIVVVLALLLLVVALMQQRRGPGIEPGSALVVPVEGSYVEAASPGLLSQLAGFLVTPPPSFTALLSELAKAERDARIATVVLRVRGLGIGWGKAQELRAAIARLRAAGKRTVAYLEVQTYGANLEYYVATACDELVLAPGVPAPLSGLRAEYLFLGGLWESLGVQLDVLGAGEYKGAVETLGARGMSAPHREMADSLLDSLTAQLTSGVALARGLEQDAVRAAIDAAPMPAAAAVERKLVDRVAHWDEIFEGLGDPPRVEGEVYARVPASRVGFAPVARFALVYGAGNVVQGEARGATPVFASDAVAEALEDAAEDDSVKAIVLRLDSPGGSGAAAEQVWRAVRRARESKPVIASMSDLAASAAYYVAAGADRVLAQPGSYTGSIGVFVVRPSFGGLLDKLDVGHETLLRGQHADLLALMQPLSPETRERFRAEVEGSYVQFVERVAEGRALSTREVDEVARGRVWTGEQARERGLVDALGGLRDAVLAAKEAAGLAPDDDVELVVFPAPRPLAEQLREAMSGAARAALAPAGLPIPQVAVTAAAWLADLPAGALAWLPPIAIEIR
jgi:protease-4